MRMVKYRKESKYIFLVQVFFLFCSYDSFSQNLIPNAGFEHITECPIKEGIDGQIYRAIGWFSANRATPDLFHVCNHTNVGVPKNYMGSQSPFAGDAYAGILVSGEWREYISVRLRQPLKAGQKYYVSAYVSISPRSENAIYDLGFYFSPKQLYRNTPIPISDIEPQVILPKGNFITEREWTLIDGTFTAKGGEQWITIGNFKRSREVEKKPMVVNPPYSNKPAQTFYYIDNVNTEPIPLKTVSKQTLPGLGEALKMDNIYFRINKSELLPSSYQELDTLVQILNTNRTLEIEIIGHTDNSGKQDYNQQLSEDRAKAVKNYLIIKGIETQRLSCKGLGNKNALVTNITEKDRQLNRRVEFKVLKK